MTNIYVLVGTNPIPCYISAAYLLGYYSECKLFLVCTADNPSIKQSGTYQTGRNILNQITVQFPDTCAKLLSINDVGSELSISSVLAETYSPDELIHLNYTGGTKSMAALAYHVLSQEESFSSSYLDGRRHIMILDGDPAFSNEHDLRKDAKLKLDLQAITTLHGFDKVQDSYTDAAYGDLMERLKALLHNKRIFQIYGKSSSKKKKTPEEMAKEEEDIRRNTEEIIEASKIRGMGISEKHINKFIDGVWLEHYLYDELNKISNDIEIYHGIVKQNHFEIDLMAIYGYQMTLISVTTDCKKGGCKLKAFEAIHRAHQLGGDEAKAVLVTLMECPRTLEDDIRGTFGSTIPGFKAFGIDDFDKLTIFDDILKYAKE